MSINVRGAGNEKERRALFDFHRSNADFLVMQETHSTTECEKIWENEWGGKAIFTHGTSKSRGVAVFTTKEHYQRISNIFRDILGRVIIFDYSEGDRVITIVAPYGPNEDNPTFFEEIANELRNRQENKVIVGDFNLTLTIDIDRENTYNNNTKARDKIEEIMEEFYLKDIWRIRNQEKKEFSWSRKCYNQGSSCRKASRIDFALVSGGIDQNVEQTLYISSLMTDHRAIYLVIQLEEGDRGVGYCKFNNTHLTDKKFLKIMNQEIDQSYNASCDKDPVTRWEIIKDRIKKTAITFARNKTSENKLVIEQLSEKVNEYEASFPLPEAEDHLYLITKNELEDKVLERIEGVMFRSKVKWYELGEKNTKYFYSLEKARYNSKTCYKLITDDSIEISNPKEILEQQRIFYEKLYDVDDDVEFKIEGKSKVCVPQGIENQQNQQTTLKELEEAVKTMNNNKSPGNDGIPVDFYKVFWNKLKNPFYEMVLECYKQNELHGTARQGILNLIPKPKKDTRYIKNLRPITLLNTDYKIIEKSIANKMIPALDQ